MTKFNLLLTPMQEAELERLAGSINESKADVIRHGIRLLGIAVREQHAGNSIGVVRGERVVKELAGLWTESVA